MRRVQTNPPFTALVGRRNRLHFRQEASAAHDGWPRIARRPPVIVRKFVLFVVSAVLVVGALHLATQLSSQKPYAIVESSAHEAGCDIKGNIDRFGNRTYYGPESKYYPGVFVDAPAGERWFCSEADAQAAGWEKSPY